jgi:hypothetical protein
LATLADAAVSAEELDGSGGVSVTAPGTSIVSDALGGGLATVSTGGGGIAAVAATVVSAVARESPAGRDRSAITTPTSPATSTIDPPIAPKTSPTLLPRDGVAMEGDERATGDGVPGTAWVVAETGGVLGLSPGFGV